MFNIYSLIRWTCCPPGMEKIIFSFYNQTGDDVVNVPLPIMT